MREGQHTVREIDVGVWWKKNRDVGRDKKEGRQAERRNEMRRSVHA